MASLPIELKNSRRILERVTYTPLRLPESLDGGGALETASAVRGLGLIPGEAAAAASGAAERVAAALTIMERLITAAAPPEMLAAASDLAKIATAVITDAAALVTDRRRAALDDAFDLMAGLIREYLQGGPAPGTIEARLENLEQLLSIAPPSAVSALAPSGAPAPIDIFPPASVPPPVPPPVPAPVPSVTPPPPVSIVPGALAIVSPPIPDGVIARLGSDLARFAYAACVWADRERPTLVARLRAAVTAVVPAELSRTAVDLLLQGLSYLIEQVRKGITVKTHLTQRTLQPLGLLHLEQLVTTPLDVERGELVYTLPLAPFEKVTLAHKEWTLREEEYTQLVEDYLQNYSERGVADTTDIAVSSRSETEHTKTLSMSRPATGAGVTLADPVDTQSTSTDVTRESQSQEKSRRDTRQITEKASSLAVRDQKISFTVVTTSGTEDFTARIYENKAADKMMVIDYFRRMRKWRNSLFRTGVRLTYDVVLPDPGRCLRQRWLQLSDLDAQIAAPFDFEPHADSTVLAYGSQGSSFTAGTRTVDPTTRASEFDTMSVEQLDRLARQYGVTLPPAPRTLTSVEEVQSIPPGRPGTSVDLTVAVNVTSGYRPVKIYVGGRLARSNDADVTMKCDYWGNNIIIVTNDLFAAKAIDVQPQDFYAERISAGFIAYNGAVGEARLRVDLVPTPEAWREWRDTVWSLLRQGALAQYNAKRETLRQKRAALLAELQAVDTLTLRRMEREQIMKLVLDWLFPDFATAGNSYKPPGANGTPDWRNVLEYGEYIKFVHDAIDWDRIVVLLYPYFWAPADDYENRLYLGHPDAAHREFLRAGAARVVLAIKPGFEDQVVSLLDQGAIGALTPASRFVPIIGAVAKAEAAFTALRDGELVPPTGGDPRTEPPDPPGVLIGEWIEYTPTSALDIDVTLRSLL